MVFEEDLEEALPPAFIRDPGAPTEKEIASSKLVSFFVSRAEREIDHTDVLTEANTLYQNYISITCSWGLATKVRHRRHS